MKLLYEIQKNITNIKQSNVTFNGSRTNIKTVITN